MEEKQSLYAVIPAAVLYDTTLPANAVLIYGEIVALASKEGYCWARNQHFAAMRGIAVDTVSRLIKKLQERGHISVEVIRDPDTNEVINRKIWVTGLPGIYPVPPGNISGTSRKFYGDPPGKKVEERYTRENRNTPQPPKGAGEGGEKHSRSESKYQLAPEAATRIDAYCAGDPELAQRLAAMVDQRIKLRAINSDTAIKLMLSQLDKLSGRNRGKKLAIIDQSLVNSWKTFYPLREDKNTWVATAPNGTEGGMRLGKR